MRILHPVLIVPLIAVTALAQQGAPTAPRPLDPITDAEAAQARQIAEADARVKEQLGSSFKNVYVHSTGYKRTPNDDEPQGRYAELLYTPSAPRDGVEVLVDLGARKVVGVARVPNWAVPLGTDDVAEALEIFRASAEGRSILGNRAESFHVLSGPMDDQAANSDFVAGLQTIGSTVDDQCSTHRCVSLQFYSRGRRQFSDRDVLVDLNTRRVTVTGGGR